MIAYISSENKEIMYNCIFVLCRKKSLTKCVCFVYRSEPDPGAEWDDKTAVRGGDTGSKQREGWSLRAPVLCMLCVNEL